MNPNSMFSDRISDVPKSFIREILKIAISNDVISFAGGLPNRELFPIEELKHAAVKVFDIAGAEALQYSNTEGFLPLREFISNRYKVKYGQNISPKNILITCGSQQGMDLLSKVLINEGDDIIIEEPGYLGAIQLFSVFKSKFNAVTINNNGPDTDQLKSIFQKKSLKLMYSVPNFQNPSGISYSNEIRQEIAKIFENKNTLIIEDNPYGELRYRGKDSPSFYDLIPDKTILLGSFSKTTVPGFRLGWIVAPDEIMDKLIVAKQASDLHTNIFTQRILFQYLTDNSLDNHIKKIKEVYGKQCLAMINSIKKYFPKNGTEFTEPEGGMFLWVTLPAKMSSMKLFDIAIRKNVAFVPGHPFYTGNIEETNTLRLNFSCVDETTIEKGIKILGESINEMMQQG